MKQKTKFSIYTGKALNFVFSESSDSASVSGIRFREDTDISCPGQS